LEHHPLLRLALVGGPLLLLLPLRLLRRMRHCTVLPPRLSGGGGGGCAGRGPAVLRSTRLLLPLLGLPGLPRPPCFSRWSCTRRRLLPSAAAVSPCWRPVLALLALLLLGLLLLLLLLRSCLGLHQSQLL
jgi:hypothetical protein